MSGNKEDVRLFIAVPCYGGTMHGACTLSLLNLDTMLRSIGIGVQYEMLFNESLITRARNILVDRFLKSNCTHLLFIDSDIQFQQTDILKMLECGLDIIGGVYAKKEILWDKLAHCVKAGKSIDQLQNNTSGIVFWPMDDFLSSNNILVEQPLEVRYVGTGLMLIKRHVFEKISSSFPGQSYDYKGEHHYCFFDTKIEDNAYLSEDYYFCNRWRELGGKVYAALWTQTVHYGTLGLNANVANM
jgi:hypothetical protein